MDKSAAALDIIYDNKLSLSDSTIEFVDKTLRKHADVDQTFSEFYKYSYLIFVRNSKMDYMKDVTNLRNQFLKLLDHNQRCMRGASVAFMDAMNDYKKYQQGSGEPDLNLSWFDRKFESHAQYAKMVKNVPAEAYLFMVAFTFALLQYEIMFNARCAALYDLYEKNITIGNPAIVSVPATITMQHNEFYSVFVNGIGEWLKVDHASTDDRIASFMKEIGTNALLDKQFKRTINPILQQQFIERSSTATGGRHVSKRRNKKANTRARKMRRTNKRRSYL